MKSLLLAFIVLCTLPSWAQEGNSGASDAPPAPEVPPPASVQYPSVRPKPPEDLNKESSSFIGDPENLDPMGVRRDSLKEDAEPVLEDIKQVLDAPSPKKEEIKKDQPENFQASGPLPKKKTATKKNTPKKIKKTVKKKPKVKAPVVRNADDPDEAIEKGFHNSYLRYNSEPTSVEAWSTATFGRSEEVYIVQKGDTLWSISETLFGDSLFWPKIWALNRQGIVNPHFIIPGMKVRFFPGSSDYAPTLAVGETAKADGGSSANFDNENNLNVQTEGFSPSNPEASSVEVSKSSGYSLPNPFTEFTSAEDRKLPAEGLLAAAQGEPTPLPPSIPVYRSSRYYAETRKVEVIDLEEPEKLYVQRYIDIILTDRLVLSDLKIHSKGNNAMGCNVGEVLKNFDFVRKTQAEEYTILEPLDKVELDKKVFLYPYRKVGTLSQYADGKLRIKECTSELNRQQLFVPTSVVNSLKTNKTSQKEAHIIGGPEVKDQQYYSQNSLMYADMGSMNFEIGQSFGIISERLDKTVGQFKVMDRFGSYAVGFIATDGQPIENGDRIVSQ